MPLKKDLLRNVEDDSVEQKSIEQLQEEADKLIQKEIEEQRMERERRESIEADLKVNLELSKLLSNNKSIIDQHNDILKRQQEEFKKIRAE
jgi:hypothetical protein